MAYAIITDCKYDKQGLYKVQAFTNLISDSYWTKSNPNNILKILDPKILSYYIYIVKYGNSRVVPYDEAVRLITAQREQLLIQQLDKLL